MGMAAAEEEKPPEVVSLHVAAVLKGHGGASVEEVSVRGKVDVVEDEVPIGISEVTEDVPVEEVSEVRLEDEELVRLADVDVEDVPVVEVSEDVLEVEVVVG